jgi:hypothetical protein
VALCASLAVVPELHALGAGATSSPGLLRIVLDPPPPPPLNQAQVDALITKLGDNAFAVRQQAQADLEAAAAASSANAYLIVARLKAIGLTSNDLEVSTRSDKILKNIIPLGAVSISIDDRTEKLSATSGGNNRGTVLAIQPGPGEEIHVTDPFFDQFVGATKTVALIEADAKKVGNLTPASDVIFFEAIIGGGGNRLVFMSDGEDPASSAFVDCTNPLVVCMNENGAFQDVAGGIFGNKKGFLKILVASDAPEPATIVLVAPGIAGLLIYARRRRSSSARES